jgi:hypothetical protein
MMVRIKRTLLAAAIAAVVLAQFPAGAGAAAPAQMSGASLERSRMERRILAVVRQRTADGNILERMQAKLTELDPAKVRLAASLCDHIAGADRTAGADIAFTLVAALIALS